MNARAKRWILLSILSSLALLYLLGNDTIQLWDRDEPRYAQTSRQMLESGDWVVPRFLDTVRTAKPVLIYWCQASAMAVLGDTAFAARLPSAVAMLATLAILAAALAREVGSNRALWTVFIFGSCALAIGSAKMCLTDAVLLLFITIGQLCIYRIWRYGVSPVSIIVLGVSIGLAGLTKGPVALGVNLMTVLALAIIDWRVRPTERTPFDQRQFTIVVPIVMAMIFIIVMPWLWLIQERAPGFLTQSISHDVIDRARSGHEGHKWPPGFYTLAVWGTFFPWSLLLVAAGVNAWRQRHQPATRFAVAAVVGPWVMFELVAGKLPHYVLPTYPALAYLVADMLVHASRGAFKDLRKWDFKIATWVWALLVSAFGFAGWAGVIVAKQYDTVLMIAASAMAIVGVATGVRTAMSIQCDRAFAAARAMGIGMIVLMAIAATFYLPRFAPLRISSNLARIMFDAGMSPGEPGYMIDYKEPSLAFHQGGGLREMRENAYLNDSDPAQWPRWVVITQRSWEKTRPDVQSRWELVGSARGLAYNEGGKQIIHVLRRK